MSARRVISTRTTSARAPAAVRMPNATAASAISFFMSPPTWAHASTRPGRSRTSLVWRSPLQGCRLFVWGLVNAARPDDLAGLAVVREDRPERLIQILAVLEERLPEHAFLNGAELPQRAGAAAVAQGRARLEALHAHRVEREVEDQLRRFLEHPGAPVAGADREAPLGVLERCIELADLDDADGGVVARGRHGEADVLAGDPLADRPLDEALEAF